MKKKLTENAPKNQNEKESLPKETESPIPIPTIQDSARLSEEQRNEISNITPALPTEKRKYTKRGTKGMVTEAEANPEEWEKIANGFSVAVKIAMEYGAELFPVKIPVSDLEKELMSESLALVLKKYKPALISSAPEFMLLTAGIVFVAPRVFKRKEQTDAIPETA